MAKERAELALIEGYLPRQLGRDEIAALAAVAIAETGASAPAEQGKVMQALMPRVRGKADGKLVAEVVRGLLTPATAAADAKKPG